MGVQRFFPWVVLPLFVVHCTSAGFLNNLAPNQHQHQHQQQGPGHNQNKGFLRPFGAAHANGNPQQGRNLGPFDPRRLFLLRRPNLAGATTPVANAAIQQKVDPDSSSAEKSRSGGSPLIPAPVIPPEVHAPPSPRMRQKFFIKPMTSEKESRQFDHSHDGDHKQGTVPVGELADSLRHLLGLKEGGKVMINFAVNKPTEHRTARGHLYIDSSHEQLHMPEFADPEKQFRENQKIHAAVKSKELLKEAQENGAPGPIWKYLMDHATPIKDGNNESDDEEHQDASPRPNRNRNKSRKNHNGNQEQKFKKNRRPLIADSPAPSTESPESDEKLNDEGKVSEEHEGPGRPQDESEAFFDDEEDFDEDKPVKGRPGRPGNHGSHHHPNVNHHDAPNHGRPNQQPKRRPQQQRPFRKNRPNGPQLADRPKSHLEDDSDPTDTADDGDIDDTAPQGKPAFIPTAYEIHVQPVIATSAFHDSGNLLNSFQNEPARKKHGKRPEFNVPVPNFPSHVKFGDGAFRLVHQTDWTPIAADAAGFGFGQQKHGPSFHGPRRPHQIRPVSGPSAFQSNQQHEGGHDAPSGDESEGPSYDNSEPGSDTAEEDTGSPYRGNSARPPVDDESGSAPASEADGPEGDSGNGPQDHYSGNDEEAPPSKYSEPSPTPYPEYSSGPTTDHPPPSASADGGPPPESGAPPSGEASASGPTDDSGAANYEYDSANDTSDNDPNEYDEPYSEGEIDEIKKYFDAEGFPQFDNNELNEKPGDDANPGATSTPSSSYDEEAGDASGPSGPTGEIPARENTSDEPPHENSREQYNKYAGVKDNTKTGHHPRERPHYEEPPAEDGPGPSKPHSRPHSGDFRRKRPSGRSSVREAQSSSHISHNPEQFAKSLQSGVHYAQPPIRPSKRRSKKTHDMSKQHRSNDFDFLKTPFKRHSTGFQQPPAVQAAIDQDKEHLVNSTLNDTKIDAGNDTASEPREIDSDGAASKEVEKEAKTDAQPSAAPEAKTKTEEEIKSEGEAIQRRESVEDTDEKDGQSIFSVKKIKLSGA